METQKILQLSKYQPPSIVLPKQLNPIFLEPLPPLPLYESLSSTQLKMLGLLKEKNQQKKQTFGLFFCCSCAQVSRQTLQQINSGKDILHEEKEHMKDLKRKDEYHWHWKNHKKRTIKKEKMKFEKAYESFGHLSEEQWKENLNQIFS